MVTFPREQAMKAEGKYSFLNLGTRSGWVVKATPCPL